MLEMQDAMNTRINPDWRDAGNAWYRAIWIECGEMLDHYGWKWWKHQEADMPQVILEVVDIWHFMLSDELQNFENINDIADQIIEELKTEESADNVPEAIELLAAKTLMNQGADIESFTILMKAIDLDMDELYRGYVGKNVLNFFRQDHGYKEGTYQKIWNGLEDNEVLVNTMATLDSDKDSFRDELYAGLKVAYDAVEANT